MSLFREIFAAFEGKFRFFRKKHPIENFSHFYEFFTTRASFVAQKTLYGYLKTRMGTKYPELFSDDIYVESINIAKWQIYAACLSDLAIFMTANLCSKHPTNLPDTKRAEIARQFVRKALEEKFARGDFPDSIDPLITEFETRLIGVNWDNAHEKENAFVSSPAALVKWSPIAEELKKYDAKIVRNSIRFQWNLIRQEFHDLAHYETLFDDWENLPA